ncbi:putative reverse transcriptase domain-containing protein [Tanacetum coccineum]
MMSHVPSHRPLLGLTFHMSMMGISLFKHRECDGMPGKFKLFKNLTGYRSEQRLPIFLLGSLVMAASAIVIYSDSSDESVGSPPSRIILFGSIPTVIPVIQMIWLHQRIFPRYELLHHFYALILQRLLILLIDNHLRTLMLLSLLSGGARTLTARKSVRPLSSHHLALRYTSHHLDRFTSGSSSGHSSSEHSLSRHSISGHSLSGHTPPDTIVADSSAPPRFVYPPLARTPQCSEAYHHWRTAPLSTMYPPTTSESFAGDSSFESSTGPSRKRCRSLVDSVPSSTPVYGSLAPTRADLLPPRKRFRDSYSSEASMEEDTKVGTAEAKVDIELEEYEAETSTGDTVELGIDTVSAPIVDERIVKPVGYDSSNLSGTRDGIARSVEDMPINLDDAIRDFYHHMYKVHVDRIVEIETVQRQLEAVQLIASGERASMVKRIESLRLENLKVQAFLGVERDRVDSLRLHMSRSQEEFCQIRKDRDDVRWRLVIGLDASSSSIVNQVPHFGLNEAIKELVNRRVEEALAAYEATRAANAFEAESQSQNGSDGDNGNGGNGNGGNGNGGNGNGGNENPNGNDRGARPIARECTYQDFMKCQPLNFKGTKGVVGLIRWCENMETVFHISNCPEIYQLLKLMTEVYCPRNEIQKMETDLWNLTIKKNDMATYTQRFQELTMMCTKMIPEEEDRVEKFIGGLPDNIKGNVIAAKPTRLQDAV